MKSLRKGWAMNKEWEDKMCDTCAFKINNECRCNPPQIVFFGHGHTAPEVLYPIVRYNTSACSLWREKECP